MTNPILEGFGKSGDLSWSPQSGFMIDRKPVMPIVRSYDVVEDARNVALGVKTAAIAGLLTGGIGLLGGAAALRKKRVAVITWTNGAESLVEVRSAQLHQALLRADFALKSRGK